jgi:hypothetical protein
MMDAIQPIILCDVSEEKIIMSSELFVILQEALL